MDVTDSKQAEIAERAGARSAVMAARAMPPRSAPRGASPVGIAEKDSRDHGRRLHPVMASAGRPFAEAQSRELGVDYSTNPEVLPPPTKPITWTSTPQGPVRVRRAATWASPPPDR